jgi:6-phosphogluconolactonase
MSYMIRTLLMAAVVTGVSAVGVARGQTGGKPMVYYAGSWPEGTVTGIYSGGFDPATGELTKAQKVGEAQRSTYVLIHPTKKYLYAVDQVSKGGKPTGMVRAYTIEKGTGKLKEISARESGGEGPCYLATDAAGRWMLTANYGSGSVEVLPVEEDGSLGEPTDRVQFEGKGPNPKRQAGPHAHCFDFDPSGKFVVACDLGTDLVHVFRLDEKGKLAEQEPGRVPAGGGARHIAWGKDGKFAYVVNEMGCSITAFAWDAGKMTAVETVSSLPPDHPATDKDTGAEIAMHPNGKWLYASNRGHDSIVKYDIDETTGKLTNPAWVPSGGKVPRYFGIEGKWMLVANQGGEEVVAFEIGQNGELTMRKSNAVLKGVTCLKLLNDQ